MTRRVGCLARRSSHRPDNPLNPQVPLCAPSLRAPPARLAGNAHTAGTRPVSRFSPFPADPMAGIFLWSLRRPKTLPLASACCTPRVRSGRWWKDSGDQHPITVAADCGTFATITYLVGPLMPDNLYLVDELPKSGRIMEHEHLAKRKPTGVSRGLVE